MAGSGIEYEELHFGAAFANPALELFSLKQNAPPGVMLKTCHSGSGEKSTNRRLAWATLRGNLSTTTKLRMSVSGTIWVFK